LLVNHRAISGFGFRRSLALDLPASGSHEQRRLDLLVERRSVETWGLGRGLVLLCQLTEQR
jgi:hypothetical protein